MSSSGYNGSAHQVNTAADHARDYLRRHWAAIPVPYKKKGSVVPGWPNLRLLEADIPKYFDATRNNVGVLTGVPSGGLVDIDLDDPTALQLADAFLPLTRSEFGRKSKLRSHRLYVCDPPPTRTVKFEEEAEDKKTRTYVEVRSTGGQTVFPGSTHPTGELVQWHSDQDPTKINALALTRAAAITAVAALIVRYMPEPGVGKRHNLFLGLAGWLLRDGWALVEVSRFIEVIAKAAGEDAVTRRNRVRDAETTAVRLQNGDVATGLPTVALILGEQARYLSRWLSPQPVNAGSSDLAAAEQPSAEEPAETAFPAFPIEVLPGPARRLVEEASRSLGCAPDLVAVPALATLGAAIGTHRCLEVKAGWREYGSIYAAVVADPGSAKSPAQDFATEPLHVAQKRFHEDYLKLLEAQQDDAEESK